MRWRQVVILWLVAAGLGAQWLLVEQARTVPTATSKAQRGRFLPVAADGLREMRLVRGGRLIVTALRDGRWEVVEPADAPIPPDLVSAFASALTSAEEIERVAGGETDLAHFGLDEQASRIQLRDAGTEPLVVLLGATNPTGTAIYARRGGDPSVYLIGRNVGYYQDLLFQALPPVEVPGEQDRPIGG